MPKDDKRDNLLNEKLEELVTESRLTNKSLHSLGGAFAPLKLAGAILEKLLLSTVSNAVKFDKMAVQNAGLNTNVGVLTKDIAKMGSRVGTITEHTKVAIGLHKLGYRKLDKSFQDSLVLLNKQGGQGDQLIQYMDNLLSKGASQETQLAVAKAITEVANNTTVTADAAIASLSQLDDVTPMLMAMGFGGKTLEHLAAATKDMPKTQAVAAGKFIQATLKDHGPSFFIGGAQDFAERFFKSKNQKEFNEALMMIPKFAKHMSNFSMLFSDNVFTMKMFQDTFMSEMVDSSLSFKEGVMIQQKVQDDQKLNADKYIKGSEAYDKALTSAFDLVTKVGEVGGIALLDAVSPLVQALTRFANDFLGDNNLFENMLDMGRAAGQWARTVGDLIMEISRSSLYAYSTGNLSLYEFMRHDKEAVNKISNKLISRSDRESVEGVGVNIVDPLNLLSTPGSLHGTIKAIGEFSSSRQLGKNVNPDKALSFVDSYQDLSNAKKFEMQQVVSNLIKSGKYNLDAKELGIGVDLSPNIVRGVRTESGKGTGGVMRFAEAINDSTAMIVRHLQQIGEYDEYTSRVQRGWGFKKVKRGSQYDYELHSPGGASVEARSRLEDQGIISRGVYAMSEEDFAKLMTTAVAEGTRKGQEGNPERPPQAGGF